MAEGFGRFDRLSGDEERYQRREVGIHGRKPWVSGQPHAAFLGRSDQSSYPAVGRPEAIGVAARSRSGQLSTSDEDSYVDGHRQVRYDPPGRARATTTVPQAGYRN